MQQVTSGVTMSGGVARTEEELALLRVLTARLGDQDALGVYNDWLEEHADPRAAHLRRSLAAYAAGKRLPRRPPGIPAEWEELVGLGPRRRIRARADTCGRLAPHLPTFLNAARPCMRIDLLGRRPMSRVPLGASRAGGLPDLPPGTPWPMCDDELCGGRWPTLFLLQIDLADLAGTLGAGLLPDAGLLSLFFYPENEPRGVELFYTPPGVPLARIRPPRPYTFHPHQIGRVRFPTGHTRPIRLTEMMHHPIWDEALPDELKDFNVIGDTRLEWALLGAPDGPRHLFATPAERKICPHWGPDLWFAEVPPSHLELFELWSEGSMHWHFVERLHVFADAAAARAGVFDKFVWGTI